MALQARFKKVIYRSLTLVATLIFGGTCQADNFIVGVAPQFDARTLQQTWLPILKELNQRTGHNFILRGSQSIPIFDQQLKAGEFDFAYINPYQLLKTNRINGYIPLVRDVASELHGILIVRKDSPYQQVDQLRGQTFAFPSPNALSASLMLRAALTREFKIPFQPRYVNSHDSVYLNVVLGNVAAGGGVTGTLAQQPPAIRDQLRVIYTTSAVVPHPLTAHPRVPKTVRDAVQKALLTLGQSAAGRQLLERVPIKTIGPAYFAEYAVMEKMHLDEFYEE